MDVTIIKPFTHKNLIGKEQELVDLYYDQMAPMLYIADTYECSCDTIIKWFKANNLKLRTKAEAIETKGKFRVKKNVEFGAFRFTHPNLVGKDEEIKRLYIDEEYSVTELCEIYNLPKCRATLTAWIKRNGLKLRSFKEARVASRTYNKQIQTLQYKFDREKIDEIVKLYLDGHGAKKLGKKFKLDPCVIFRILNESGISLRSQIEAQNTSVALDSKNSTIIEKYGGWANFRKMQSAIFFEQHGVENPMQLEQHFHKQQENAKKLKTATVNGKDIKYQGFELLAINQLLEEGYLIEDIKNGKGEVPNFIYHFDGRNRRYYPDIYIPKDNRIIEVKSKWTYEQELSKNLAKRKIVIDSGYEFDFYIMEK